MARVHVSVRAAVLAVLVVLLALLGLTSTGAAGGATSWPSPGTTPEASAPLPAPGAASVGSAPTQERLDTPGGVVHAVAAPRLAERHLPSGDALAVAGPALLLVLVAVVVARRALTPAESAVGRLAPARAPPGLVSGR